MTIERAIDRADRLRPNQYTKTEKIEWLSELDMQVYSEVILKAEENWKPKKIIEEIKDNEGNIIDTKEYDDPINKEPVFNFEGYDETTPLDTPLLIDDLYGNTYTDYLLSKYDYVSGDDRYANSSMAFDNQYNSYCAWYIRNHMPRQPKVRGI